jgi:hypothetical protein
MPCQNDMIRTLVEAKSNEAEWSRQIPALLMQAQISSSRSNERVNIGIFGDVYGSQPLGRELIIRLARHLAKGTIHILRKHLYNTKLNLISQIFSQNLVFLCQIKRISFSSLHFDKTFKLKFRFF